MNCCEICTLFWERGFLRPLFGYRGATIYPLTALTGVVTSHNTVLATPHGILIHRYGVHMYPKRLPIPPSQSGTHISSVKEQ